MLVSELLAEDRDGRGQVDVVLPGGDHLDVVRNPVLDAAWRHDERGRLGPVNSGSVQSRSAERLTTTIGAGGRRGARADRTEAGRAEASRAGRSGSDEDRVGQRPQGPEHAQVGGAAETVRPPLGVGDGAVHAHDHAQPEARQVGVGLVRVDVRGGGMTGARAADGA